MTNSFRGMLTDAPQGPANDILMAKEMAEALHQHYPGHLWAVTCDGTTGVFTIRDLMLSGQWGMVGLLRWIYSSSDFKRQVIMYGGELLERYRLRRGKLREDEYSALPMDFAGRLACDKS
jgi:hypothetical protein